MTVSAFKLAKTETTRAQFAAFVKESGYEPDNGCFTWTGSEFKDDKSKSWKSPGFQQSDEHPVVCVSHKDAETYARWLSEKTGSRYRLPTEAEWEYAARAGTKTVRYWGDDANEACRYANVADLTAKKKFPDWTVHSCNDDFLYTAPVGHFRPNRFMLNDLLGNVWEWVADCWHESYKNAPTDGSAWSEVSGGDCERRVIRGGSWGGDPRRVRSANRSRFTPGGRSYGVGFRLAQDI